MISLQDRADIQDVMARYALAADRQDYEALLGCFTDDAVLAMAHVTLEGIAAIREAMTGEGLRKARAASSGLQFDRSTHLAGNIVIEADGPDGATVESSAVVHLVGPGEDGDRMVMRGVTYSDMVRRTDAGWRIARRVHGLNWQRGPERI